MSNYKETWLPHLKDAVPTAAYGSGSCMYVMSIEGWRRGLELTFHIKYKNNLLSAVGYTLSDGTTSHFFHGSRGDYITKEAIKVCSHKGLTNKCLADANVPVPEGRAFPEETTNQQILDYSNTLGYPLVLKPNGSEGGIGVITNIKNEEEMKSSLRRVRDVLGHKPVIVERFFVGEDFRVYVLDGKVIGAFHRRAQSVVGDGKSTIQELLDKKNVERHRSPFLAKKTIKIDKAMKEFLAERNLTGLSVPKEGERVFLRRNGEFFGERDSVNATDTLTPEIKAIAIAAVEAIPGLEHGGVDMLIDLEKNIGVVNEVNSRAQISNHVFPVEGVAVDIPKYIIDYYFPETKDKYVTNVPFNFEYQVIMDNFEAGTATEIKIPAIPKGANAAKQYDVFGTNLGEDYQKWLQKRAKALNLHGYVRTIDENKITVVVAGSEQNVNTFENVINKKSPKVTKINGVESVNFSGPVNIGFRMM